MPCRSVLGSLSVSLSVALACFGQPALFMNLKTRATWRSFPAGSTVTVTCASQFRISYRRDRLQYVLTTLGDCTRLGTLLGEFCPKRFVRAACRGLILRQRQREHAPADLLRSSVRWLSLPLLWDDDAVWAQHSTSIWLMYRRYFNTHASAAFFLFCDVSKVVLVADLQIVASATLESPLHQKSSPLAHL